MSALEALRDSHELIELLSGWQWQAMYAARRDGASWEQVAATVRTNTEHAPAGYVAALDRLEHLGRDVRAYGEVR